MTTTSRAAALVTAVALSASPVLLSPTVAAAADGRSGAQVEQDERNGPLQLRRDGVTPSVRTSDPGGGAEYWQYGLGAALGAVVIGGVVVAARQVSHHHHGHAVAH
jgi:hypothetical protein